MKQLLAVAALVSLFAVSCSTQQPTPPLVHRDGANGTPVEGDGGGGGDGGGTIPNISHAFVPASQTVAQGANFDVSLDVTSWPSNIQANAWEATINFDTTKVALSGNTFSYGSLTNSTSCAVFGQSGQFGMPHGKFFVNAVLLGGCTLHSTGRLITYHFHALNSTGTTSIYITNPGQHSGANLGDLEWYDAGYYVQATSSVVGATVTIN